MKDCRNDRIQGTNGTDENAAASLNKAGYGVEAAPNSISYAPKSEKKSKNKKNGVKTMASLCAACVVLSGAFGFGGTLLANRLTAQDTAAVEAGTGDLSGSARTSSADTVSAGRTLSGSLLNAAANGYDLTYAQAAALVKDSVVEINTESTVRSRWFQYTTGGAGSGVIISEDGYILTNAHVILDSDMAEAADSVTVRLTDGSDYPAEVIAYDADEDVAVLKIEADGLTPARAGDSDELIVGEELLIVGNPLGELGGSVSNGIVSATEREIEVGGVTMHLIQTNAAVNPGNSGGGMFNMKGELVGIVNAKSSGTGIEGIGFAIPINQVMKVTDELMENGYVSGKPVIGVSLENVSDSGTADGLASYFSSGSAGYDVYVRGLVKGMNDGALQIGDRIVAVNGQEIASSDDVKAIVSDASVGDRLTFQVYRNNKLTEVEVTVFENTPGAWDNLIGDESAQPETGTSGKSEQNAEKTAPKDDPEAGEAPFDPDGSASDGSAPGRRSGRRAPGEDSGESGAGNEDDAPADLYELPDSLKDLFEELFGGR